MNPNKLLYSKSQIDRAGDIIVNLNHNRVIISELRWAVDVLTYWRTVHNYPINTFKVNLRSWCKRVDTKSHAVIVAQRLKRTPSIALKLRRFSGMKLSRMQDIGGLRAILKNKNQVYQLTHLIKQAKILHVMKSEKDYIKHPKPSGYRGIHLIYQFRKSKPSMYDGLLIELQIRTKVQHSWATAVEIMGTFLQQSLKSSQGSAEWLDFFALVSSGFALLEKSSVLEQHSGLSKDDLISKIISEEARLKVINQLTAFSGVVEDINSKLGRMGHLHLITLDTIEKKVVVESFSEKDLEKASQKYTAIEGEFKDQPSKQVVLVKSNSMKDLKKSYPNYFLDTEDFISNLRKVMKMNHKN